MNLKVKLKRGPKTNLPLTASDGELLYTTDTREMYIGTGSNIKKIQHLSEVKTISSNYNATFDDDVLLVSTSSNSVSITLPSGLKGKVITVKLISGSRTITVLPSNGTIDGNNSYSFSKTGGSVQVVSDGTNWFIINKIDDALISLL